VWLFLKKEFLPAAAIWPVIARHETRDSPLISNTNHFRMTRLFSQKPLSALQRHTPAAAHV
jgi:hypothetical protein